MAPLTISLCDPLAKCLLTAPRTLCSVGLEALALEGGMLPSGDTTVTPLNWKLRLPVKFMPLNQQARNGLPVLAGAVDPDYQGEIGLLLHNGSKEEYVWNTGDPSGRFLVLSYPVIKTNRKLQQPNPGRTTNSPEPSGMKV